MGEMKNVYKIFGLETERPRRKPSRKWVDNVKQILRKQMGQCGLVSYGFFLQDFVLLAVEFTV
jgi:hypothetical protein